MTNTQELKMPCLLISLCLLYITISLACDPAAYRLVSVAGLPIGGSSFIYAGLYTLLDMLTRITGRNNVIKLIFVFHLCDLLFSYILYFISMAPLPSDYSYHSYNTVISSFPRLFWSGILGAIIAGVVEVTIFAFIQKRIRNFGIASGISTIIILSAHNIPTDYFAFKDLYPNKVTQLVGMNFLVNIISLLVYITLGQISLKLIQKSSDKAYSVHNFKRIK